MNWHLLHPKATKDNLGFLPYFLDPKDKRKAKDQFNERYVGGWNKFEGFTLRLTPTPRLLYPGDPPTLAIAETQLGDERIILFEHAWVVIVQKDGSYEVARMD